MDLHDQLKTTIEEMGRRFEEFKVENDAAIKKGVRDALGETKLEKLSSALDDLAAAKEQLERGIANEATQREELERKMNRLRLGDAAKPDEAEAKAITDFNQSVKSLARERGNPTPAELDAAAFRAYKSAFLGYFRKGRDSLNADEVKAMQVGVDADGGYLVPADLSGRIVSKVWELSPIRAICSVQAISSDRLEGITDLGEAGSGWVGETASRGDTTTPQVGKYEIPAHEQYAQPKATQKMLDDSTVDVEAWLSGKVADKLARDEATAFVSGDGVAKPRGFTTYTTAATADATRAWGTLEHVKTGVNGDFAAANAGPYDCLFDLEMAFKPAYLAGARFVTRRTVMLKLRKLKASDYTYLWQPGLIAGAPSTLIGYPITICEDMPALGTGSLSLALGNFSEAYQIVDRLGIRMLRDPFTDKPYVKYYTIRRVGGAVVNFEALKFLNFAA